jgi:SAM-dependent methyltransferase/uncharacterized protein YbaR (Trm112 family)
MKKEFLSMLECPYCGSSFEIKEVYYEEEDEIVDGSVSCACAKEYPILEGILNLKLNSTQGYILDMLKKRKERARYICLSLMLKESPERFLYLSDFLKSKGFLGRRLADTILALIIMWNTARDHKYFSTSKTFFDLLGNDPQSIYFKHRFSSQSLWSTYTIIPSLKMNSDRVLDLCCGMGHASSVISVHVKPKELVCVDQQFRHLYFARKFFVSNAHLLCADVDYGLPFKSGIFDSVLMIDAYNYVRACASKMPPKPPKGINTIFDHFRDKPARALEYKSLFKDFERFVEYVCKKRSEGKIKVMTMGDFAASLNKTYVKTGA